MQKSKIILSTLNARYHHSSFGLRCLFANLAELQAETKIKEYVINKSVQEMANDLLSHDPEIIGFGVYIWNTLQTAQLIKLIKEVSPKTIIIVGGPEVSFESETQIFFEIADYIIKGEADLLFYQFCRDYLFHQVRPDKKLIQGPLPDLNQIQLPYTYYTDEDIKNRTIYVEASRGCPYKCEYCLSSLDLSVRNFPLDTFLVEMNRLIERGARGFKFVDRTFNLSPQISEKILQFFLEKVELGLFLHFELVPDRLPDGIKKLITQFPEGALQFEIGIQTWNPEVAKNVSRRQNYQKIEENLHYLKQKTSVHLHTDLIVGLPGETRESFKKGFDHLITLAPHEIQVGLLKRLKGTPITRHDKNFSMKYDSNPPFQILENKDLSRDEMFFFQRFSKFWDLIANSGNFRNFSEWIKSEGPSCFDLFSELSDYLFARFERTHSIARDHLRAGILDFLIEKKGLSMDQSLHLVQAQVKLKASPSATPQRQSNFFNLTRKNPSPVC